MPRIPYYEVDAFATRVFSGNPAGVCLLEEWLPDELLQAVAMENNLSETAFLVGGDGRYALRWFTPTIEVDLCGHATLASAHVLFEHHEPGRDTVAFDTRSGELRVSRAGNGMEMDFPIWTAEPCAGPAGLREALGEAPREVHVGHYLMAVFEDEMEVARMMPDFRALALAVPRGVIVTAHGATVDFVSRFFAPYAGIDEDPVTGSSHCMMVPFWSHRLGKRTLRARQLSRRGGDLECELRGTRCLLRGGAVTYLVGEIIVPAAVAGAFREYDRVNEA